MSTRSRVHVALEGELGERCRALLAAAGFELVAPSVAEVHVVAVGAVLPGRCLAVGEDLAAGLQNAEDAIGASRIDAELVLRVQALIQRIWRPSMARTLRLVAHDLNNPLGAARILAELLQGDLQDPEQRRDAEDLLGAVDHASLQVETLTHAPDGDSALVYLGLEDAERGLREAGDVEWNERVRLGTERGHLVLSALFALAWLERHAPIAQMLAR
jgi:signal transduction histidine kinase